MISIHAPLAGCDYMHVVYIFRYTVFQSTHPLRGATALKIFVQSCFDRNFNPRTPCGVRPWATWTVFMRSIFQSTHPLRGATDIPFSSGLVLRGFQSTHPLRGATITLCGNGYYLVFQSTHPLRGATNPTVMQLGQLRISIHAPLAGCDWLLTKFAQPGDHFNPRTPCGVRRCRYGTCQTCRHFNPRTPCGVRQIRDRYCGRISAISIHAPLAGCDFPRPSLPRRLPISIHAPLAGCDSSVMYGLG